ncbi:cysteine dioxygenase [Streptomyces lushanensis]|uniref:cysteine dioxygenase n=1 Tax=Streptomyces lushanensis TaxID=1434255 RepID=UPI00099FA644|nr:cysteine dioxygenase [Streptomyces lushanensis]
MSLPVRSSAPDTTTDSGASTATSPSAASPASGPTPAELLDFVRRTAADSELISSLPLDPEGRTWIRLDGPAGSEAWLIGWPPGTGTGWHDHGGSHGAFATAAGALKEDSLAARLPTEGWKTLELAEGVDRERKLTAGEGRAFGRHHVHEVRNESGAEHAVSVHAYFPPLPLMRRYSRTGAVLRLEHVERPEEWQ